MERFWITLTAVILGAFLYTEKITYADTDDARIQNAEISTQRMEDQKKAEQEALERSPAMQKRIEKMSLPAYKMDGSQEESKELEPKESEEK